MEFQKQQTKKAKTERIFIRIDPVTKKALFILSNKEGKTASQLIREMINTRANKHSELVKTEFLKTSEKELEHAI